MIDFNKLINLYLKRDFKPKEIGRYYPSEAGNCLRKTYYSYVYPKPIEEDLMKIFHAGNIIHDLVVNVLKSEKTPEVELLKSEMPVKVELKDFTISGRIDDLVLIKHSGKEILVEAKSTAMLKAVKQPQKHHIMQLQFYMYATGVHNGLILYIEKNTLQSKVFTIEYDKTIAEEAIRRFTLLDKHLKEKTIPIPEARSKDGRDIAWMCKRCEFWDQCYKDTPASKEFTLIEKAETQ